ncbi:hypothetical protein D3C78_1930370 [compost metagenome]
MNISAMVGSASSGLAMALSSASISAERFGSRVSGSWLARNCSRSSACLRPVMSENTPT